jgi:hypothetical protein
MTATTLALTPQGHLTVSATADGPPLPSTLAERLGSSGDGGSGQILLTLGAEQVGVALAPVWAWWRDIAVRYLTALCTLPTERAAGGRAEATLFACG